MKSEPHQTVADAVAAALRQAIVDGGLPDGHALRQEELAREFRASRVPIREALLKLEAEGLVVVHPRRGVVVASLHASDFEQILEMRCALEPMALEFAIPRLTPEILQNARHALEQADESIRHPQQEARRCEFEARWGRLNWTFHRSLYVAANRPRLLDTIENLHVLFARHLRARPEIVLPASSGSADGWPPNISEEWPKARAEHHDIYRACERGDLEEAVALLRGHIQIHGEELVRRLKRQEEAAEQLGRTPVPA